MTSAPSPAAAPSALDPALWQPLLERHAELFGGISPGSALALLSKPDWDARSGAFLEWRAGVGAMAAARRPWTGVGQADVDLVFVAMRDALAELAGAPNEERLGLLKRMIHRGDVLFFVMKTKCALVDAGWEDFLDSLGLAFMGACR